MNVFNSKKVTCFISPHSDDAVMSSFGLIRSKALSTKQILLTVFGVSNYVELTRQESYPGISDFTEIRLREDKIFAQEMGVEFAYFLIPDCLKRMGRVCFSPNEKLDILDLIISRLTLFIQERSIEQIVIPYPFGYKQHLDHRLIFEACKYIAGVDVFFVDDVPYGRIEDTTGLKLVYEVPLGKNELKIKHVAMDIYSSQMCDLFHSQVDLIAERNNYKERVFKNEKSYYCHLDSQQ